MLVLLTMSVLLAIHCNAYEVNSDYLFIFDHTGIPNCIGKYCHLFVFLYHGLLSEVRGFHSTNLLGGCIGTTCWVMGFVEGGMKWKASHILILTNCWGRLHNVNSIMLAEGFFGGGGGKASPIKIVLSVITELITAFKFLCHSFLFVRN